MDFASAVEAVERLARLEVGASFWGSGQDASVVGTLQGELKSHLDVQDPDDLPESVRDAIGETAVTFAIGDHWGNVVLLWPSRFVSAEHTADRGGVAIKTLDGEILVRPKRPWID